RPRGSCYGGVVRCRLSGPHRHNPPSEPRHAIEPLRQIARSLRMEDERPLTPVPYAHPSGPPDVPPLPTALTRGVQLSGAVLIVRSPESGREFHTVHRFYVLRLPLP